MSDILQRKGSSRFIRRLRAYWKGGASRWVLGTLAASVILSLLDVIPGAWLAVVIALAVTAAFWRQLDRGMPLAQIAALLACLQWLVGPVWYYGGNYAVQHMGMWVPEKDYFAIAVPGCGMFSLGLLLFGRSINQRGMLFPVSRRHFFTIGVLLNAAALCGDVAGRVGPSSLAFAFFLVSQVRYVGVLYLWFSEREKARWLAGLCILPLFMNSSESAMFHDLLIWCGLLFCFWFASRRRTIWMKTSIVTGAALLAFTVQGVKKSYREKVWSGKEASFSDEVIGFWSGFSDLDHTELLEGTMTRLNQGWIVSRVFYYVPANEPFANGETVRDAVIASIVPRFLYADKAEAGGRQNFIRFTGLPLNEVTSMNLSLLGEGYANFGKYGAFVFLFVAGAGISLAIGFCNDFAGSRPAFLFWIPLIFYQAIKAETDSTEIFNQILKGGALAFAGFWVVEKFYSTRFKVVRRRPIRVKTAIAPITALPSSVGSTSHDD